MLFQYTLIEDILNDRKTQTRRSVKAGQDWASDKDDLPIRAAVIGGKNCDRIVYRVGHSYAVQPGRGKPTIQYLSEFAPDGSLKYTIFNSESWSVVKPLPLRIMITSIRREDVRTISAEDVKAEGSQFASRNDYLLLWGKLYDPNARRMIARQVWREGILLAIQNAPAALYQAWVLNFKVEGR